MRLAGRAPPPRPFIATPPACCRRVCADYPQGPRSGTADARRADVVVSDRQARAHGDTHPEIRVGPPTARLPARRPQAQTRPTQTQVRRVQTTAQSWCSASSATSRSHNASYGPHTFRYPDHRAQTSPPARDWVLRRRRSASAPRYIPPMVMRVERDTLARMLRSHGEDDLADRAASLTDDELTRIGRLGAYYAFSEDAMALGGSMGGTRALSLATIDVLEDTWRDLRRHHTDLNSRAGCQRSRTRASGPKIVSFDVAPRRNSSPIRATERKDWKRVAQRFHNHETRGTQSAPTPRSRTPPSGPRRREARAGGSRPEGDDAREHDAGRLGRPAADRGRSPMQRR